MPIRVVKVNKLRTPEQRASVCYVGREFAGWPGSLWGNPYKPSGKYTLETCLEAFSRLASNFADDVFVNLWKACDHGDKPLGCWCTDATVGDGQPVVCHAQILAQMLHDRFVAPLQEERFLNEGAP